MGLFPTVAAPVLDQLFDLIDRTVLSVSAASIAFTGISPAFRLFELDCRIISSGSAMDVLLTFNSSGSGYSFEEIYGDGTTATGNRTATSAIKLNGNAGALNGGQTGVFSTLIGKPTTASHALTATMGGHDRNTGVTTVAVGGRWTETSSYIARMDIAASAGSFAADSELVLTGDNH